MPNVDGLIEGSVLRAGDQVHITAQLIRGDSDEPASALRLCSGERGTREERAQGGIHETSAGATHRPGILPALVGPLEVTVQEVLHSE
jgi:hypothetical protein